MPFLINRNDSQIQIRWFGWFVLMDFVATPHIVVLSRANRRFIQVGGYSLGSFEEGLYKSTYGSMKWPLEVTVEGDRWRIQSGLPSIFASGGRISAKTYQYVSGRLDGLLSNRWLEFTAVLIHLVPELCGTSRSPQEQCKRISQHSDIRGLQWTTDGEVESAIAVSSFCINGSRFDARYDACFADRFIVACGLPQPRTSTVRICSIG